jgi:hypothetical protein
MENSQENSVFDLAASFVLHTNRDVFLTGKAGTGKTTFLKFIREQSPKKTVVVAPTGIAAINAEGVTIHSFFQLPFGPFLPGRQRGFASAPSAGTDLSTLLASQRYTREKRTLFLELELLIIDEVSMLRADMLDAMDGILRHFRKKPNLPFGGVQVLYIGDLYQLPPVIKDEEWDMLRSYYQSMFFFDALVMSEARPISIELDKIYRQGDERFIALLNNIRNNIATEDDLILLNRSYDPYFHPEADDGYIILTSHNYRADKINQTELGRLDAEVRTFEGTVSGDFNEKALPAERNLALKAGAQVMFIKNDKGENRRYYNGKTGVISRIKDDEIYIRFPGQKEEMQLEPETWRNIRYNYNETKDSIEEQELGSYKQYPLRLAWAVTIHKSQGLTFEKAIIDAGQSFAAGQVYVALSRLTSMKGLVLSSPISEQAIHTDPRVVAHAKLQPSSEELRNELKAGQQDYLFQKLSLSFEFDKLHETFQGNHQEYNNRSLPVQGEAVVWSFEMLKQITTLVDVSNKFRAQLRQIIPGADQDSFSHLRERVHAAAEYFLREIDARLVDPFQIHYNQTRVKPKTRKYIKELDSLKTILQQKKEHLRQAIQIADGLAEGKDTLGIIQYSFKKPAKTEPALKTTNKPVKGESRNISLDLLRAGKTIEDIVLERSMAQSTIETHLLSFIPTGEVSVDVLVSQERQTIIADAIAKSRDRQLTTIRAIVGESYSFNEIKAVVSDIERKEGTKS